MTTKTQKVLICVAVCFNRSRVHHEGFLSQVVAIWRYETQYVVVVVHLQESWMTRPRSYAATTIQVVTEKSTLPAKYGPYS